MIQRLIQKIIKNAWQQLLKENQYVLCKECNLKNMQAQHPSINEDKIDLVDFGRIKAFMYMDDLIYDQFTIETAKHFNVKRIISEGLPPYQPKDLRKADSTNVIEIISNHYASNSLSFTFIDIGCNNGADTLAIADYFFNEKIPAKIIAFDPGRAGNLVEHTINLNGFADKVKFEPLAVSCHSMPTIMRFQLGHTEDNRIVNLTLEPEPNVYNHIVDTITIDEYCNKHNITNHLIVKTDTQGGDYDVLMGMKNVLNERFVTFITEFAPSLIGSTIKPINFINKINDTHYLFNIGWYRFKKSPIKYLSSESFVQLIDELNKSNDWTDILAIPRNLPEVDKLIKKLDADSRSG